MGTEKLLLCPLCNEEHVLSATMDAKGNVVGWFCNRHKAVVISETTRWNGEDIYGELRSFARRNVDLQAVSRLSPEKVESLAKKMAYFFLQTSYNKDRKINYYFAHYHMHKVVTRLRSEVREKKVGR